MGFIGEIIGLRIAGSVLFVCGFAGFLVLFTVGGFLVDSTFILLFLSSISVWCIFSGVQLINRSKKLKAFRAYGYASGKVSLDDILANDPRPPVIYFRPFWVDGYTEKGLWLPTRTEEEKLESVVRNFGPFVALGDPREELPELGAARIYVGSEEWQVRATEMISKAQFVILHAGFSPGFLWELRNVVKLIAPERIFILISKLYEVDYYAFCATASHYFPKPLPQCPPSKYPLCGFIYFGPDWTPVFEEFRPIFEQMRVSLKRLEKITSGDEAKLDKNLLREKSEKKEEHLDDTPCFLCPSCGERLFSRMYYLECPNCKKFLKNRCPKCGNMSVHKAYIENGGLGDWCPNCKISLFSGKYYHEYHEKFLKCPKCGNMSVHKAYIENGGLGDWCPNCKMSLQKMKGEV